MLAVLVYSNRTKKINSNFWILNRTEKEIETKLKKVLFRYQLKIQFFYI